MSNKFIRFLELREVNPAGLDGHRYSLAFEVGEKRGDSFHPLTAHKLDVEASGTLQAVWNKSDQQMATYTGTSAISHVLDLARRSQLEAAPEPFRLNTYTAQKVPPESPLLQPGVILPLDQTLPPPEPQTFSFLSDDISELRDQINALAKDLWGGRLLLLSQERPLFDMYKPAKNADEFRVRIQSLGIIAKDLDRDLLRRITAVQDDAKIGEFVLLEMAIQSLASTEIASSVCTPLKQINNLRQGYPTHGDNAKKFLDAHRYFGLPYPVTSFPEAWEIVLARYFDSMRILMRELSIAWKTRA